MYFAIILVLLLIRPSNQAVLAIKAVLKAGLSQENFSIQRHDRRLGRSRGTDLCQRQPLLIVWQTRLSLTGGSTRGAPCARWDSTSGSRGVTGANTKFCITLWIMQIPSPLHITRLGWFHTASSATLTNPSVTQIKTVYEIIFTIAYHLWDLCINKFSLTSSD